MWGPRGGGPQTAQNPPTKSAALRTVGCQKIGENRDGFQLEKTRKRDVPYEFQFYLRIEIEILSPNFYFRFSVLDIFGSECVLLAAGIATGRG